jgi:hypothetical protein
MTVGTAEEHRRRPVEAGRCGRRHRPRPIVHDDGSDR